MNQAVTTTEYLPIYLESLRLNDILEFDLYIKSNIEYILFRSSRLPFTFKTRTTLLENNINRLYISIDDRKHYQKHIESNISQIIENDSIDQTTKAGIVYECAKHLIQDVLNNPTMGENIKRSQAFVESTVTYLINGKNTFHNLLKVMSYDYYIYTHSVNVCTFSLALAKYIGIKNARELNLIGTGALLHDVGKTSVPDKILNKRGPLNEEEMNIIRKHPQWGADILGSTAIIMIDSNHPVLQHHERIDGSGYPNGSLNNDIHLYSRIVMIADVFDAMTTRRVYKSAKDTFWALKEMYKYKETFDKKLLEHFTKLMGP
ncbi:MAG: HD domain-containing phosphohydrolase [Candidatus Zixiibacteriota bacterium]